MATSALQSRWAGSAGVKGAFAHLRSYYSVRADRPPAVRRHAKFVRMKKYMRAEREEVILSQRGAVTTAG